MDGEGGSLSEVQEEGKERNVFCGIAFFEIALESHQRGYERKCVVVAVTDKVDLALLQSGNIPNVQL